MIVNTNTHINSPVRQINAMVDVLRDSTIAHTWTNNDRIISISIERPIDDTKFFGYGICQKANVHLIDREKEITDCATSDLLDIKIQTQGDEFVPILPYFQITRCNRDELTNELSITAYDSIYYASEHYVNELDLPSLEAPKEGNEYDVPLEYTSYTLGDFIDAVAEVLNMTFIHENHPHMKLDLVYHNGYNNGAWEHAEAPNYEGTENLRDVLDDIAEMSQTIYFITHNNELVFKRLDKDGEPALTIRKDDYIKLLSGDNRRLTKLVHTSALGDNISVETTQIGTTQYIRDNPLWNLRTDIEDLMNDAIAAVGNLEINKFDCSWRGNWYLEIGDKIGLVTKDDKLEYAYLLNDVWNYTGAFNQHSQWSYTDNEVEGILNPLPLGERLKETYAKVDKVNQEIELLVSDINGMYHDIGQLTLTTDELKIKVDSLDADSLGKIENELAQLTVRTDSIIQSVSSIETETDDMGKEIERISNAVEQTMTKDEIKIVIQETLDDGVTSVTTSTGFTFNDEGLTINKNDTPTTTNINDNGMYILDEESDTNVLEVNNHGVWAKNLEATTYLIIGKNSRFEDYDYDTNEWGYLTNPKRTGCFWIGVRN